jgi:hypothetical protein
MKFNGNLIDITEGFFFFIYAGKQSSFNTLYKDGFCIFKYIYPTRCNVTQFILSGNCFTCFGCYFHPSSGVHTTISTASGICHTITATCHYRGGVGTAFQLIHDSGR